LEGYDIVTFYVKAAPECSPLSCNGLANEIDTNEYCLLPSLENAREMLEKQRFKDAEPGLCRVFAVYSTEWP
jgi:predicted negative regulator of RcsB-dependent stress response